MGSELETIEGKLMKWTKSWIAMGCPYPSCVSNWVSEYRFCVS